MSSIRQKRNVNEILEGNLGVGEICGGSVAGAGITVADRCNAITKCSCDSKLSLNACKCTLETWFIVVIAVMSILILVGIIYCILRALGCCKR